MIKARIRPYFAPLGLQLREVTPQHIEDFYQSILADGCTTNTVIHYHAIIRKALQTAVKKDILLKNPADKVDRPKKNVFHGSFYSEEEMLTLFDAVSGDPLELCVKIAAYDKMPGQMRSEKDVVCKPFKNHHAEQLKLVTDFDWIDFDRLSDVDELISSVLSCEEAADYIDEGRIHAITESVQRRIGHLQELAMTQTPRQLDTTEDDVREEVAADYAPKMEL